MCVRSAWHGVMKISGMYQVGRRKYLKAWNDVISDRLSESVDIYTPATQSDVRNGLSVTHTTLCEYH